jgi:hypothetical protein
MLHISQIRFTLTSLIFHNSYSRITTILPHSPLTTENVESYCILWSLWPNNKLLKRLKPLCSIKSDDLTEPAVWTDCLQAKRVSSSCNCRRHEKNITAATTTTKERVAQGNHHSIVCLDESLLEERVIGSLGLVESNNFTDPAQNFLLFGTLN